MDKRHIQRIKTIQNLFAYTFPDLKNNLPFDDNQITKDILSNKEKIDSFITEHAPKFPIERIAKVDLSILRLAIYELIIRPTEPYKVVINEAVELAKEFAGDRSFAFVNAVLGNVIKNHIKKDEKKE